MTRDEIAESIGRGLHSMLRVQGGSAEAALAWLAISEMDDDEWCGICRAVASELQRNLGIEAEPKLPELPAIDRIYDIKPTDTPLMALRREDPVHERVDDVLEPRK